MTTQQNIVGAKLALFLGERLVVIRRDVREDIPWPDHLDLPGGGREPGESVETCVLRETFEEVGLSLRPEKLIYRHDYIRPDGAVAAFFAAECPAALATQIVFGDEGQGWQLMPPDVFIEHPEAIPHLRDQVHAYVHWRAGQ